MKEEEYMIIENFITNRQSNNLVKYYKEKVQQYKAKGLAKYTIKSLFKSPYLLQFCTEHQIKFKSYPDFTRHFKKWKHHVEVLEKSKPKGLLN